MTDVPPLTATSTCSDSDSGSVESPKSERAGVCLRPLCHMYASSSGSLGLGARLALAGEFLSSGKPSLTKSHRASKDKGNVEVGKGLIALGGIVAPGCVGLGAHSCPTASASSSPSRSLRSCMSVRTLDESLASVVADDDDTAEPGGDEAAGSPTRSSGGGSRSGRSISFDSQLSFREYPLEVADYPNVVTGPALGIGWDPVGPDRLVPLEEHEKNHPERRSHKDSFLATHERWQVLVERGGYTQKEIKAEMKKIAKARKAEAKLVKKLSEQEDDDDDDDDSETRQAPQSRRGSVEALLIQASAKTVQEASERDDAPSATNETCQTPPQGQRESAEAPRTQAEATKEHRKHRRRLSFSRHPSPARLRVTPMATTKTRNPSFSRGSPALF